ncbi:MAG: phospho-N-acetylmuramoyl-pentapeptide-transferase [Rhodospirillaceae bacterium]|jgi:phospho-N-acetylmuramoyl-pentapeptide-transferase|nr:phospho-N-acetylmuramoyl-pentapeptide-transferase [Rhodospirillaceae bacterium]MBT4044191.1 phospho-N-acetylmuramoyl-pentapeptide-transferase [Rhodospirillaceae bacterium]MBT4690544.1 phospho-N-acetylmuramoyl-pentapeptide-transferase [Rhodospirillaceae bacterium]MBT5083895.1 phospho-N-acetylmuramoyl-pentapeptide-transferase [Rhodospirillaceae bacterium]MBT5526655.1 phospho-N-acetylmuramoyl-pentapeptide-transferase [Rhodospirillaceae bacterium]
MLFNLLYPLAEDFRIFNLFRYLTFRTGAAVMTALIISFIVGPPLIRWLRSKQGRGQPIRDDGPERHIVAKQGTPTMGGFLILLALSVSTLLWADLSNQFVWAVLLVTAGFGLIGFADDYLKVTQANVRGLPGKLKLILELIVAVVATIWIISFQPDGLSHHLALPFFKDLLFDLGLFFIPFGALVMVGSSNAVNLTDGLDGLAIGPLIIAASAFALIAYLCGNVVFSGYLQLHAVPGAGELAVYCGALVGAGLGFLWFNAPPAMVFMGDTGSLSLGGGLGAIAVVTKNEMVLGIIGGLFVLETVSVIVQVASFKMTGRRVFRMAPLHHHYEQKGWAEPTIVIRFWIIAVILALVGLATLKLR